MSVLNSYGSSKASGKDFLSNPLSKKVKKPQYSPDFKEGFHIIEYVDGSPGKADYNEIILIGNMMPKQPFEFGGKQRIVKDYYPGNSEPVVHVLGPEENTITLNGTLKEKRYNQNEGIDYTGIAEEVQKQIDAMRLRGNMVKLQMGEWYRFGFIEESKFTLRHLNDIDYQIVFVIIGFNKALNYQKLKESNEVPLKINNNLINLGTAFQAENDNMPSEMPISIADLINDATNSVAGALAAVTGYVDSAMKAVEDISTALNRAIGLVRYAQIAFYKYKQRLGRISITTDLGPYITGSNKKPKEYRCSYHINTMQSQGSTINLGLASMMTQLKALKATAPLARYRSIAGDTLQRISNKFYNDPSYWEKIYDHNKLTSTVISPGTFLEIPKI
jgi:hypothetical protein